MNDSIQVHPIPCHVVAGPLGAGKTSAILHFLQALADSENIAVIVNDFGRAGLDAAILREAGASPEIRNIPGGCLCCSSIYDMREALEGVLKREGISRIIFEPSGLAVMPDFIPYLQRLCDEFGLELRPVIALISPKRIKEPHYQSLPFFRSLIDHADILVANRTDQCTEAQMLHFRDWTARLNPPKLRILETSFGRLPLDLFDAPGEERPQSLSMGLPHHHEESSGGFIDDLPLISETDFTRCLFTWIEKGFEGAEILRFKALLETDQGWRLFEIAEGEAYIRGMKVAERAQLDWICRGVVTEEAMRAALNSCARQSGG